MLFPVHQGRSSVQQHLAVGCASLRISPAWPSGTTSSRTSPFNSVNWVPRTSSSASLRSPPGSASLFIYLESTWLLFSILGLDIHPEWLQLSVSEWDQNPDYCKLRQFVSNVHVINDIAKRGIKLITDFIGKCHDESQRQALLQVVECHREQFPYYLKSTLAKLNC